MASTDPTQPPGFKGHIGRTREESTPHWKPLPKARHGSPNVVMIYMDDMGYADVGCYGSEIATPNIDALAASGLRFNHYTTHPLCSPARAALLTGRNAHSVATGWLATNNPGFPGYSGDIPLDAPTFAEVFRAAGYATIGIGKWHNATDNVMPNAHWPTQRGFERFYGFMEGETSYFFPARIVHNNVLAPIDQYPKDYYATDDWTEQAMRFLRDARNERAEQPILLYLAYNAVHGPLQAKEPDLQKYRGRYDAGWDVIRAERLARQKTLGLVPANTQLSPRDPSVPAWTDIPADQRTLYVRHMETYAAMLDCVDQNVGRLVAQLRAMGELENTIICFAADNGGTSAGGPKGEVFYNRRFAELPPMSVAHDVAIADLIGTGRVPALYPMGWGQVSNTPFPSYKTYTGGGGRRVACIFSWPQAISARNVVSAVFAHVTDVMPTLLDLAGVSAPTTSHGQPALPMHGRSLAPVLLHGHDGPTRTEQYYECWANRAYWRDGWIAVSLQKRGEAINFDHWTLHHQASDFSESVDVSAQHPELLKELAEAFDRAAWANMVYPLDNRLPIQKLSQLPPHMQPPATGRRRFLPGGQTVARNAIAPLIANRCFRIDVHLRHRAADQGVVFAIGEIAGGMVMYIEDGALHFLYNGFGQFHRISAAALGDVDGRLCLQYEALGQRTGRGRLLRDDTPLCEWTDLSPTLMGGFHEGLDIGLDRRAPVDWELYQRQGTFRYTGVIHELVIEFGALAPDSNG